MYKLDGKVALITGAAIGIGRGIALRLAAEGADIAILDINLPEAKATARAVQGAGRRAVAVEADVSNHAQVQSAVQQVTDTLGKIDILVNNAGILRIGTVVDTPINDWRDVLNVNLDGAFYCCRSVLPQMIARGAGKVINIASYVGKVGKVYGNAYGASKFALIGLTQSLALEVAQHKINVNAVCPGFIVETGMRVQIDDFEAEHGLPNAKQREGSVPLRRAGLPSDVARIVAFLASEEAFYMTGQAINITGGVWMH